MIIWPSRSQVLSEDETEVWNEQLEIAAERGFAVRVNVVEEVQKSRGVHRKSREEVKRSPRGAVQLSANPGGHNTIKCSTLPRILMGRGVQRFSTKELLECSSATR